MNPGTLPSMSSTGGGEDDMAGGFPKDGSTLACAVGFRREDQLALGQATRKSDSWGTSFSRETSHRC